MKKLSVARRYAKALLLIGKEDGQAEAYRGELKNYTALMAEHKEIEHAICNPLYESAGRKGVLMSVIEILDLSNTMKMFLLLLFDKGRIGFISNINEVYQKLADELKGIARASVASATELSEESIEKIREALSKMTKKEVIIEVEKNPSLIGGIVTRIGDLVLDGSIKTQLINMRESLKRGESV